MGDYAPPINGDQNNPNRSYEDGNPAQGREGSIPPGIAIEWTQRELVNLFKAAGLTPSKNDLEQTKKAIPALVALSGFLKKDRAETLEAAFYPAAKSARITGSDVSFVAAERSHQSLTVTKNLTIKKPAVVPAAGTMILQLNMDASGGHAIGWDAAYKVRGKMNTGANVKNICNLTFIGDDEIYVVIHAVPAVARSAEQI